MYNPPTHTQYPTKNFQLFASTFPPALSAGCTTRPQTLFYTLYTHRGRLSKLPGHSLRRRFQRFRVEGTHTVLRHLFFRDPTPRDTRTALLHSGLLLLLYKQETEAL
uniref:(northern house mosquito) hypothetical protein n=1 Tax=Culex pipiens TaxID=7175 RepID=A0A8D8C2M8_CULPI